MNLLWIKSYEYCRLSTISREWTSICQLFWCEQRVDSMALTRQRHCQVFFCDEPTSGLSATDAETCMRRGIGGSRLMSRRIHKPGIKTKKWLVVWNINFIFPYIGLLIIPIDFHIFQRGWNHQAAKKWRYKKDLVLLRLSAGADCLKNHAADLKAFEELA